MPKTPLSLLLTSSVSMRMFLPYLERSKLPWRQKAKEEGLPLEYPHPDEWLPLKNYAWFLKKIAALASENMPIEVGRETASEFKRLEHGYIKPDDDLKQALESMVVNSPSFSRQTTYWVEKLNQHWCLCNKGELHPSFPGNEVIEWFRLSFLIHLCRYWLGSDWEPSHVHIMTGEKLGGKYEPYLFKNTVVIYDQPFVKIELPFMDAFEPLASVPLKSRDIQEIKLLADSYCHLPTFTLDWLASLFGVTNKTLYRYFKNHDTNFAQIRNEAVLNKTYTLLTASDDTVSDIAYRMGYNDVSNFNRAIKRLTGKTPAQIRQTIIAD
ncbi:helix-turn-helix domain-containing protein [Vibrio breoganii]|uniref:helix-turn-helix domain-containing protein n=1 Tax=Vibrio breoganii TaxID=553239 RepID=UPI000C82F4BA|nr:helix-turn-helix domain-containing protein [Vibrio breoganii]PMG90494.1 hypothetical protein BCU81_05990 [Vibrio breoganii]PMK27084.1 hypothetical protein BCU03_17725 [Vibrio breoganii]PML12417.1 hypothetical protein BCT84_15560 [Vibrio breoganii]